ncbi:hypothetical protein X975_24066, partial [Stegodyphus mimosarum]
MELKLLVTFPYATANKSEYKSLPMESVKQLVSSIIESFLGPNKSYKSVIDGKEIHFTKCPVDLLQKIDFKEPLIYLLEETLCAHHE